MKYIGKQISEEKPNKHEIRAQIKKEYRDRVFGVMGKDKTPLQCWNWWRRKQLCIIHGVDFEKNNFGFASHGKKRLTKEDMLKWCERMLQEIDIDFISDVYNLKPDKETIYLQERAFKARYEYELNCIQKYDRPGEMSLPPKIGEQMKDYAAMYNVPIKMMKDVLPKVEDQLRKDGYKNV